MVNLNDSLDDLLNPEKLIPENFYDSKDSNNYALKIDKENYAQFVNKTTFSFNNIQNDGFTIADEQGNVSFKIDKDGNTEFNIDRLLLS